MDTDAWDKRYVRALEKAFIMNLFLMLFAQLGHLIYIFVTEAQLVFFGFRTSEFFIGSVVSFMVLAFFLLIKARNDI